MNRTVILLFIAIAIGFILINRQNRIVSEVDGFSPRVGGSGLSVVSPPVAQRGEEVVVNAVPSAPETNSGEDVVEVEVFRAGIRKVKMKSETYEQITRDHDENLRETIQKDIDAGLNAAVREKEDKLRSDARGLETAMSLGAALQVMGAPDRVESLKWEPHYFEIRYVPSLDQVPTNSLFCISFWPRVGVPFDGRNGQGYQVLHLQFDGQRRLEAWRWDQPKPLGIGSVTDSINQDRYWNGSYDISPPPPDYAIADF